MHAYLFVSDAGGIAGGSTTLEATLLATTVCGGITGGFRGGIKGGIADCTGGLQHKPLVPKFVGGLRLGRPAARDSSLAREEMLY